MNWNIEQEKREIFFLDNGKANIIIIIRKVNNVNKLKYDPRKEKDKT